MQPTAFAIITTVLTGIVIAATSSWITVQLSFRKFRSERWWERKAQAYERVIEALHHSKAFTGKHLEAEYEGREVPEELKKDLRARSVSAQDQIAMAIDTGAFLLSDEALQRLMQQQKDVEAAALKESWFECLETDWSATDTYLKDLIQIAKRDLKAK